MREPQVLIIPGELPGLNEIIGANRINRFQGAKQKKEADRLICLSAAAQHIRPVASADFVFRWYCKNRRKDKDNIASAKKFIFDGLIKAGVLKNDGWAEIGDFRDEFYIDKESPRVEVTIAAEKER